MEKTIRKISFSVSKDNMRFCKKLRSFLVNEHGAVTMEYVLLCIMLAAGAMMMVITFSRAVTRQFALVSYAMSGYSPEELSEARERFKEAEENDAVVGEAYSDYMHGEKLNKN